MSIFKKCFRIINSVFDVAACTILAIKLQQGEQKDFNDALEVRVLENKAAWM
jgi:hypothetical protein